MKPSKAKVNVALRKHYDLALATLPAGPEPLDFFTSPRLAFLILEEFRPRFWHTLGQWETAHASHPTLMGALALHAYVMLKYEAAMIDVADW
jgi:hypothetical protein